MKLYNLSIVLIALVLGISSCGSKENNEEIKETTNSKYQKDLSEIKSFFCDCIESGTQLRDCEKKVNKQISEAKDRLGLSDDEWRQMTEEAGAAMRECVE